jgi:hypothetical protein
LTILQLKGAQAQNMTVNVGDLMSIANQVINAILSGVPRLMFFVWVICAIAMIGRVFGRQWFIRHLTTTELIGVCIALGIVIK